MGRQLFLKDCCVLFPFLVSASETLQKDFNNYFVLIYGISTQEKENFVV